MQVKRQIIENNSKPNKGGEGAGILTASKRQAANRY
jgi:hypothetical protein